MNGGCRGRGDDAQRPVGGEEGLLLLLLLLLQLLLPLGPALHLRRRGS